MFAALIMGPAWAMTGGLDWPRGWRAVSVFFAASAIGGLWLLKTDPGLVRERASIPRPESPADRLATLLIALSVTGWFGLSRDVSKAALQICQVNAARREFALSPLPI